MENPIRKKVNELIKQGKVRNTYELAIALGVNPITFYSVCNGHKVSRPVVLKLAECLGEPELLYEYEKFLSQRNKKSNKRR